MKTIIKKKRGYPSHRLSRHRGSRIAQSCRISNARSPRSWHTARCRIPNQWTEAIALPRHDFRICEIPMVADKTSSSTSFLLCLCLPPSYPSWLRVVDNAKVQIISHTPKMFFKKDGNHRVGTCVFDDDFLIFFREKTMRRRCFLFLYRKHLRRTMGWRGANQAPC